MPDSDISSKEPNDQFDFGYVFMVGGFLVFLVFVVLLFCVCRDIRRCLFSLCGLCKEQCNGTHIQNQSEEQGESSGYCHDCNFCMICVHTLDRDPCPDCNCEECPDCSGLDCGGLDCCQIM